MVEMLVVVMGTQNTDRLFVIQTQVRQLLFMKQAEGVIGALKVSRVVQFDNSMASVFSKLHVNVNAVSAEKQVAVQAFELSILHQTYIMGQLVARLAFLESA